MYSRGRCADHAAFRNKNPLEQYKVTRLSMTTVAAAEPARGGNMPDSKRGVSRDVRGRSIPEICTATVKRQMEPKSDRRGSGST